MLLAFFMDVPKPARRLVAVFAKRHLFRVREREQVSSDERAIKFYPPRMSRHSENGKTETVTDILAARPKSIDTGFSGDVTAFLSLIDKH